MGSRSTWCANTGAGFFNFLGILLALLGAFGYVCAYQLLYIALFAFYRGQLFQYVFVRVVVEVHYNARCVLSNPLLMRFGITQYFSSFVRSGGVCAPPFPLVAGGVADIHLDELLDLFGGICLLFGVFLNDGYEVISHCLFNLVAFSFGGIHKLACLLSFCVVFLLGVPQ